MDRFYEGSLEDEREDDRVQMGRFDEAEARYWENLICGPSVYRIGPGRSKPGRPRKRLTGAGLSDAAVRDRVRVLTDSYHFRGKEVIVKAAGAPKTIRGVRGAVRYIGRLSKPEEKEQERPVPLYDGWGREVSWSDIESELAQWNLRTDRDNLSRQARELKQKPEGDVHSLSECERFRNVQARHFIWSIIADDNDEATIEKLRRSALVTIDNLFTARGFPCLWALHQDHLAHPHVHVVVGAVSKNGERLRCDLHGDYLYSMRVDLAANLRTAGLDYIATLREDRMTMREDILSGARPLRFDQSMTQLHTGVTPLWRRASKWWDDTGASIHQEQHGEPTGRMVSWVRRNLRQWAERIDKPDDRIPKAALDLHQELSHVYEHPTRALDAYLSLALEDLEKPGNRTVAPAKSLADWYLLHQPWTFGMLKSWPISSSRQRRIKVAAKAIILPRRNRRPTRGSLRPAQAPVNIPRWRREVAKNRGRVKKSILRLCRIAKERGYPDEVLEPIKETLRADLKVFTPDIGQVRLHMASKLVVRTKLDHQHERKRGGRVASPPVPPQRLASAKVRSRPGRGGKGTVQER